jgi:hypothetical protein
MKSRISENETLKKAFRDAYQAKEGEIAGEDWSSRVMSRIRLIGPLGPATSFWSAFEHLVWRLAPVSCLLVLVATLLLLNMQTDLAYDSLGTWMAGMEETTLAELFGLEG